MIERKPASAALPGHDGVFVAVVGPSGAGKDTVMGLARIELAGQPDVEFVRRVVTRQSDVGLEDHDTLDDEAFDAAEAGGAFCISWHAHGLKYGIPASVAESVGQGRVAVTNVSRGVIDDLKQRFANVVVVEITARPEILASRLAARGRETREEVMTRLARAAKFDAGKAGATTIDNSGAPEAAGARFVAVIREALAFSDASVVVER
jgi:ribose 1,5-bisphosphokinase